MLTCTCNNYISTTSTLSIKNQNHMS